MAWCWCFWQSLPFCFGWWLEKVVFPVLLAGGVAALAVWQIRLKRRGDYALEQLTKFYAPILGMSSALAAHRRGDEIVKEAGETAHHEWIKRASKRERSGNWRGEDIDEARKNSETVEKFFDEELPARFTERVKKYMEMRDFFTQNFGFADEDTRRKYYDELYDEVEKMLVYRDSVGKDTFLPGMREVLGRRVDMRRLDIFHWHLQQKVRELVRLIRREKLGDSMMRKRGMRAKELEEIREFAATVFDQAYRLLLEFGLPTKKTSVPADADGIDTAVMMVYRELESMREAVERVDWDRTKVDDSRTGQDILEKLDEILNRLHPKD